MLPIRRRCVVNFRAGDLEAELNTSLADGWIKHSKLLTVALLLLEKSSIRSFAMSSLRPQSTPPGWKALSQLGVRILTSVYMAIAISVSGITLPITMVVINF
ncbi:hypothetical protein GCM10018963_00210 [Saccharothrix longispora]